MNFATFFLGQKSLVGRRQRQQSPQVWDGFLKRIFLHCQMGTSRGLNLVSNLAERQIFIHILNSGLPTVDSSHQSFIGGATINSSKGNDDCLFVSCEAV